VTDTGLMTAMGEEPLFVVGVATPAQVMALIY
jgi:hypothetical protein